MAFRIRRGLLSNLGSMDPPPVEGELFYTTDTKGLYVGDDEGVANLVSSAVVTVNGYFGAIDLVTDDIPEEVGSTNLWFTDDRAQDAVWTALNAGNSFNTGITFSYDDNNGRLSAAVTFPGSGTVNTGTTNSLAYYTGNTNAVDDAAELKWNNVSKVLTVSESLITVNTSVDAKTMLQLDSYTDTIQGLTRYRRARGNINSPTTLQPFDAIHTLVFDTYDGTSYNTSGALSVNLGVGGSTGISPGFMTFSVTDGTGTNLNAVTIDQTGRLIVGPAGAANLTESGGISVVQRKSTNGDFASVVISNTFSDAYGPRIGLSKARGTLALPTTVANSDILGKIETSAYDGTNYIEVSGIKITVDGSVSTGVVPTAITTSISNAIGSLVETTKVSKNGLEVLRGALKLPVYATTTARDDDLPSPQAGMLVFIETGAKIQINTNNTTGSWVDLN